MNLLLYLYSYSFSILNETLLDKSIILFRYNSFGFPDNSLYINNIKYRETCIQSGQTGIFALELNQGSYSFETKYDFAIPTAWAKHIKPAEMEQP